MRVLMLICIVPLICFAQKPICGNALLGEVNISNERQAHDRNSVVIPVVFHIVWNDQVENISDALLLSQIDALNRDFNAENQDIQNVPEEFSALVANIGIRFCVASRVENGVRQQGIIRVHTEVTEIGSKENLYSTSAGGSDAWNADNYLNIWVANVGSIISGFASYPNLVQKEKDGIVIHPKFVGLNGSSSFGLGRTLTHEVGHYFGLRHLWGDDLICETDDGIADTPPQKTSYGGCPKFPQYSCGHSNMFMNFMDYTDDNCMYFFTNGQKNQILATIDNERSGLGSSLSSCYELEKFSFSINPNPAGNFLKVHFEPLTNSNVELNIFELSGKLLIQAQKEMPLLTNIDISTLQNGLYILSLQIEHQKYYSKFVVMK
jgi:Pregnancy-associated plasma protein-A/Secretion system C-terminal sorting domain